MSAYDRMTSYHNDIVNRYRHYQILKARIDEQQGERKEDFKGIHPIKLQPWMVDSVFPLDSALLNRMEVLFDQDFKSVRIHMGLVAEGITGRNGASAVTMGNDIYFAHGAYDPHSEEGQVLLAHELEHVKQFAQGKAPRTEEDRDSLEGGAYRIERMIRDNFHNLTPGSLNSDGSDGFAHQGQGGSLRRETGSDGPDLLEDFTNQPREKMIDLVMERSGKHYLLTESELEEVKTRTVQLVREHIADRFRFADSEEKLALMNRLVEMGIVK
ncbi:MAG: DUF4157 domain-containing protein [Spirochaetales bacterium]|nr:DUF4157 domain-containing protein [Spirochaetales bacterium]